MSQELQAKEKVEAGAPGEQTRPNPVFVPAVDIFESEESLTLMADMPGVAKEGLTIDLKDDTLSIRGEVELSDIAAKISHREYQEGDFTRQFTLSKEIDQAKISATLKDGVLTLVLPKVEKAKPRQIEIKSE